ncbi:MAG: virulence RhuM family protein [Treponema sp.]|nr:virulence RhuM family protein [Treponema sp.]
MTDNENMKHENNTQLLMYESADGITKIEVKLQDETVWLSIDQMAELFGRDKSTISRHIKNIFEEGELFQDSTVANFATVQIEGNRSVERDITYYNLDMIISVGYRVNSLRGTQFRQWATQRLKEYIIKGFTMDDDRLKELGGGDYWHELLDRIRDIRSSEKVMYRQVLDLYATSVDYNPKSAESVAFFKMVQNKFHYAAHGNTAAEVVYNRADSEKPFMGLTSFSGDFPTKKDVVTAKNYLDENELKALNNLVSAYFDLAELAALDHKTMHMSDYVEQLDRVIQTANKEILDGSGSISHKQAVDKALEEYRKFQVNNLSPVEQSYLETIKNLEKKAKKK